MHNNDFFHLDDPHTDTFGGMNLPADWWARRYEYPWAASFIDDGEVVVDMGYGWMGRPLKDVLAKRCRIVYGVDLKPPGRETPDNFMPLVEDFTAGVSLSDNSMDKLFCISVIEHLTSAEKVEQALVEFKRVLSPGGIMLITFDVRYQPDLFSPHGLNVRDFQNHVSNAGLQFVGDVHTNLHRAVVKDERNICAYHAVLEG